MNDQYTYAFIIDGTTLNVIFEAKLEKMFRSICLRCEAVLCCRMTPGQKAKVKTVL
jgi:magnesium-transporting ATPase (P-type)